MLLLGQEGEKTSFCVNTRREDMCQEVLELARCTRQLALLWLGTPEFLHDRLRHTSTIRLLLL